MSVSKGIKAILVGESAVGKTNLVNIALGGMFQEGTGPNTASYATKKIMINNKNYLCDLWDTTGAKSFRSVNKIMIKDSKIILIIFDITFRDSFDQANFWYNYAKEILGEDGYIIALVGNKSDLNDERKVSDEEIKKKAEEFKIKYIVTSAKNDGENFKKFLSELLEDYINKYYPEEVKTNETSETIKIGENQKKDKNQKSKNKCKN